MKKEKMYMNIMTGNVGNYDSWYYENENGETVNAVDLKEVVEVAFDKNSNYWVEVK